MLTLDGTQLPTERIVFRKGVVFKLGGVAYRLGSHDLEMLQLLRLLVRAQTANPDLGWLLPFRDQIRAATARRCQASMTMVALLTPDPRERRLALWLRGRCGGSIGAWQLYQLAVRGNLETQRDVARALQKMGAWAQVRALAQLTELARRWPRFVSQPPARDFQSRLDLYLAKVPELEIPGTVVGGADLSPVCAPQACPAGTMKWGGKPAKPAWLIRLVLDRIRFLVSGECSVDRLPKEFPDNTT